MVVFQKMHSLNWLGVIIMIVNTVSYNHRPTDYKFHLLIIANIVMDESNDHLLANDEHCNFNVI